jgi:hypothetical protein
MVANKSGLTTKPRKTKSTCAYKTVLKITGADLAIFIRINKISEVINGSK